MTTLLELTKKLHNTLALYNGAGHALGWKTEKVDKLLDESKRVIELAEQPAQQEPVAWMWRCKPYCNWPEWSVSLKRPADSGCDGHKRTEGYEDVPLYTPPPAQRTWVGLTDEEIYMNCPNWLSQEQCKAWIQQVEAKLKEKNT